MAFITAETRSNIVELAMGMLNQAPSTELLSTLIGKSTEGASLQDLADYIATTDAFTAEYPATQTAREFATEMFGKLITGGTLDADINTAVIDLLEGLLVAGTTKAEGFVAVIDFLSNSANATHPDLGDIAQSFQNRADAAEYFSITLELGGSTDAELAAAIASVTSDAATLTAANAAADATASAEEVVAGQTFTLTTGVDNISGGTGNDVVAGTVGGSDPTINAGDSFAAGEGSDTFSITATGSVATIAGVSLTGVEKVRIADTATTSATVNLAGITGVETVESFGSAGAATSFTNVGNAVDLSLANTSGAGTNTLTYTAAASAGTTTQNIALSSATGTGTTTIAGVEVVNITAEGGSSLDLIASSATEVNVDAKDETTITLSNAANTALTSISAAESEAKVTFVTDFTLAEVSVTGGSAGDVFSISGNLGYLDSLDGGDGIDTIYKASGTNVTAVASTLAAISNVEVAAFDAYDDGVGGTQADFTIDMDTLEGVSIISLTARDLATANVFTLNDLTSTQAANISVGYKTAAIGATVDIDFKDGTGTADAAVVNVSAKTGTTTTIQDTANTADELTVNIGSSDIPTTTINIDAADFDTKLTVTGGSAGRTLDMDGTAITSDTIDMSTVAANIKLQLGADTQTVTLGTGDDLVDINANYTSADSIDGGDGTDTVLLESASSLTSALNFTNVEKVRFASSASVTLNASGLDNVTIVDGNVAASAVSDVVTLLNFAGTSLDIYGANGNAAPQTINAISLSNSFNGSADALTMRIDGTDSTGADDDVDVGDITINGVETLTVTLADLAGLTLGDGAADGIAGNNLKNVTINGGDAGITYDLGDIVGLAAGRIESVDMSGLVGNVTVEVSGLEDAAIINLGIGTNDVTATEGTGSTQGVTITGNTGADTITGTGLADVINGGSGTDVITGGDGIDTLSGGAGSDTFVYNTVVAAANANNVIDFAAGALGDVVRIDVVTYTNYNAADGIVLVTASLATALDSGAVLDNTAGAVGSNYIVVDTAANIAAMDLTATTGLTGAGFLAVASDTGDVYYDADGDFTAASVVVGTLTITGSLTAANFEIV